MDSLKNDIINYVKKNINSFHNSRINSLSTLKLSQILKRKNPYLFKAKNMLTAEQIVRNFVNAHISSNEETLFGDWLEGLAIFINNKIYGGIKSGIQGIDLEFEKENIRYIVSIKSGPNWGNSGQIKKMLSDFTIAKRTLKTSNSHMNVIAINGCYYGKDNKPYKKEDYYKYCGQEFWEFISGNQNLYTEIIEPIGYMAKEKNEEFIHSYAIMINKFTADFLKNFCKNNGEIDWEKLIKYNSGK